MLGEKNAPINAKNTVGRIFILYLQLRSTMQRLNNSLSVWPGSADLSNLKTQFLFALLINLWSSLSGLLVIKRKHFH